MIGEAKRKMQFTFTRLRLLFLLPCYKLVHNMYWTLVISKSMYASGNWNTETIPCNERRSVTGIITKDNGEKAPYETSTPARNGLYIYEQMFGDRAIMQDIARMRRRGKL